jgi:hypothetical protein
MDSFYVMDVFRRGWNCSYTVADDLATYTKYVMEATMRKAQITFGLGGPVNPSPTPSHQPAPMAVRSNSTTTDRISFDDPQLRNIFRTVINDEFTARNSAIFSQRDR